MITGEGSRGPRFRCPKCGGSAFGTSEIRPNPPMGHCHGDDAGDGASGCRFTWPRSDDHKYFNGPTGFGEPLGGFEDVFTHATDCSGRVVLTIAGVTFLDSCECVLRLLREALSSAPQSPAHPVYGRPTRVEYTFQAGKGGA